MKDRLLFLCLMLVCVLMLFSCNNKSYTNLVSDLEEVEPSSSDVSLNPNTRLYHALGDALRLITEDDENIFYSSGDAIMCVNKRNGERNVLAPATHATEIVYSDGEIYYIADFSSVCCVNTKNGEVKTVIPKSVETRSVAFSKYKFTHLNIGQRMLFLNQFYTYTYDTTLGVGGYNKPWSDAKYVIPITNGVLFELNDGVYFCEYNEESASRVENLTEIICFEYGNNLYCIDYDKILFADTVFNLNEFTDLRDWHKRDEHIILAVGYNDYIYAVVQRNSNSNFMYQFMAIFDLKGECISYDIELPRNVDDIKVINSHLVVSDIDYNFYKYDAERGLFIKCKDVMDLL